MKTFTSCSIATSAGAVEKGSDSIISTNWTIPTVQQWLVAIEALAQWFGGGTIKGENCSSRYDSLN